MNGRTETGKRAEDLARTYLEQAGFVVLHVRWQHGHKELDIVAEREQMLHIIEVRSRTEPYLIEPPQTVQYAKQQNVVAAARAYICKYKAEKEVQFDIVSVVYGRQEEIHIEYIPNAFYPYHLRR